MCYMTLRDWHVACKHLRMLLATHSLAYRVHTRVFATLMLSLLITASLWTTPSQLATRGSQIERAQATSTWTASDS